ncbi:MAG: UDP-N-acetylmuramate dehydrogenase [Stomatobaculum sp.]|nr:UDP-N-acetylmuramate dehydrogenase [Stomatobaculum sp.]
MYILRKNEPMRLHTTFRVGGPADTYAEPEDEWELKELLDTCEAAGTPYLLIGHGSNLLIGDGGFRGTVICLGKAFSEIRTEGDVITARAGALLSAVANTALEHGLTGMEFASGIPGSVGGALVMNAGAYGGEIRDILLSADILEMDGSSDRVDADGLELGYRTSNITALGRTVLGASFRLQKGDPAEIEAKMKDLNGRRKEKQPLEYPSAGSTFKRPEGYFAGKLIEDAGLKGFSIGGAQVSEKHAGFVINRDNATAKDILDLIKEVQRRVFEDAGVRLETEIRMAGEF